MALAGQRILVTGASSGLGRALAVQLAEAGAQVLATARREDRLHALASEHAGIEPHALDLTDARSVSEFCAGIDRLDGAVLNAGVTAVEPFLDGSNVVDAAMVETNIMANVRLARALARPLRGGRMIFVGSLGGVVPLPYQAVYSGTKAFIRNFGLALRQEWKGEISVGIFEPGGIRTEMTDIDALSKLDKHLADVDEVAAELLAFYETDHARRIPGRANRASALAARLLPNPLLTKVMERMYRPR